MNKNLLKLCVLGCAAFAMNACDTGEYNDLECDPATYKAECLSENALMFCNAGKLEVQKGENGAVCLHVNGEAKIVKDGEGSIEPVSCTSTCNSTTELKQCNADGTTTTVDCSASGKICENGVCVTRPSQTCEVKCVSDTILSDCVNNVATTKDCSTDNKICGSVDGKAACVDATTPEVCTESVCDADGKLKICVIADGETEGTYDDPIDCTKDESGEDTGKVCGKDENDKFACVTKTVETCTESVCDADGKLKVCVIADGETEGIYDDPFDCTKDENGDDTGKVCGKDENDKFACVTKTVETCTESVCADGVLKVCEIADGETEGVFKDPVTCADTDQVCGTVDGKAACVDTCTASVCTDGVFKKCEIAAGADKGVYAEPLRCSILEQICGEVAGEPACVDPTPVECEESGCKVTEDGEIYLKCNNGIIESRTLCTGDTPLCASKNDVNYSGAEEGCIAKIDAGTFKQTCADEANGVMVVDETGHIVNAQCGTAENGYKSQCKVVTDTTTGTEVARCLEPTEVKSLVGFPCTCDGEDCESVISGYQVKNFYLTTNGQDLLGDGVLASIKDTDSIVIPNLFAKSISGCEALEEELKAHPVDGMAVACYREAKIVFSESIADIIGKKFVETLKKFNDQNEHETGETTGLADFMTTFGNILKNGIEYKASSVGYCTIAAMDTRIDVKDGGLFAYLFNDYVFDATKDTKSCDDHSDCKWGIARSMNQGTVVNELDSDDVCPDGSSYFRYNLKKDFSYIGMSTVAWSLCLQDCTTDDDCNEGYSCIDMDKSYCELIDKKDDPACFTYHGEIVEKDGVDVFALRTSDDLASGRKYPDPKDRSGHKVCFSKDAIGSFLDLKGRLNQVKKGLKDAL